jgi:predicted nucleic acid-binding protein
LKLRKAELLVRSCIQRLTIYEVLNALWKELHLLRVIPEGRAVEFADVLKRVVSLVVVLDIGGWRRF